jgi:hypothetical protein
MHSIPAAIYARVSSEQQAEAHPMARQVVALQARVTVDGLSVSEARPLLDEGYRGATLGRPALERRRDVVASGSVDRLSVPAPDRLARQYAYQVLLGDAFRRAGGLAGSLELAGPPRAARRGISAPFAAGDAYKTSPSDHRGRSHGQAAPRRGPVARQ